MTKVEQTAVIERPVEEVWDYVHDPANDPVWQSTLLETKEAGHPLAVGSRLVEVRRFLGKRIETEYEVTELEPHTRSAIRALSGPIPFVGSYEFEPANGATRFTMSVELDGHGFFKLAEPVFARMVGREMRANIEQLKDVLEARAEVAVGSSA
jgi:uncharacterized membrane protein